MMVILRQKISGERERERERDCELSEMVKHSRISNRLVRRIVHTLLCGLIFDCTNFSRFINEN